MQTWPDWVIWGGESGPKARDDPVGEGSNTTVSAKPLRVFGKQWGTYAQWIVVEQGGSTQEAERMDARSNGRAECFWTAHS